MQQKRRTYYNENWFGFTEKVRLFQLSVTDNEIGFDTSSDTGPLKGTGMLNLYKRAELCGGRLSVCSEKGSGTKIILEIDQL